MRTNLVSPVVDGLWVIDLFAKTMDHFGRGPAGSLHEKVYYTVIDTGWQCQNKTFLNRSYPPLCSAPTASGPGWESASLQTYNSCHWGPAGSQSCM